MEALKTVQWLICNMAINT